MKRTSALLIFVMIFNLLLVMPAYGFTYDSASKTELPNYNVRITPESEVYRLSEEESMLTIEVTLSEESAETVAFSYKTMDGSALMNTDYLEVEGTLIFDPGQVSNSIEIPILTNDSSETESFVGEQLFFVNLYNPQNALFEGDSDEQRIMVCLEYGEPVDISEFYEKKAIIVTTDDAISATVHHPEMSYRTGSEIVLGVEFSEPILHAGSLTMMVNGDALSSMETPGTVAHRFTFLYTVKESDLASIQADTFNIELQSIDGAVRPEDKAWFTFVQNDTPSLSETMILDAEAHLYNAQLHLSNDTDMTTYGRVEIDIYNYRMVIEDMLNHIFNRTDIEAGRDLIYCQILGEDGTSIDVDMFYDDTQAYKIFGEFELPVNKSEETMNYLLRLIVNDEVDPSIYKYFSIDPVVLIDEASDISIVYENWPPNNKTKIKEGLYRKIDYQVNIPATWQEQENFIWVTSDEEVATIDQEGNICLRKDGQVYFSLLVLNDLEAPVSIESFVAEGGLVVETPVLTIGELAKPYISILDEDVNIKTIQSESLEIKWGSNLTEINGSVTEFVFRLYEVERDKHVNNTEKEILTQIGEDIILESTVENPISSYLIDEGILNNIALLNNSNYAVELESVQKEKDKIFTDMAYIEVKSPPAACRFIDPETFNYDDEHGKISIDWVMENLDKVNGQIESSIEVKINNETVPYILQTGIAAESGVIDIIPRELPGGVIRERYSITMRVRNNPEEAWNYSGMSLNIYNYDALKISVDDVPEDHIYMSNVESISQMTPLEIVAMNREIALLSDIGLNIAEYNLFGPDNYFLWSPSDRDIVSIMNQGEESLITYDQEYDPKTVFDLYGENDGESVISATHLYSELVGELDVKVNTLQDELYLFYCPQGFAYTLSYTNGNGQIVKTDSQFVFDGKTAVYEASGIASDVVVSYIEGDYLYRAVIQNEDLVSGEGTGTDCPKTIYPQNNFEMKVVNETTLYLNDPGNNPYSGDIRLIGGVYVDDQYRDDIKLVGEDNEGVKNISTTNGYFTILVDPVALEAVYYKDIIKVMLQLSNIKEISGVSHYYLAYDEYGNRDVQTFSEHTHPLNFVDRGSFDDSSIFSRYTIVQQTFSYGPGAYSDTITKDVDYLPVTDDHNSVHVDTTFIMENTSVFESVNIEAIISDGNKTLENNSLERVLTHDAYTDIEAYPFADILICEHSYDYIENSSYKIPSGESSFVRLKITDDSHDQVILNKNLSYKLLNMHGVTYITDTFNGYAADYLKKVQDVTGLSMLDDVTDEIVNKAGDNFLVKQAVDELMPGTGNDYCYFLIRPTDNMLIYEGVLVFALGSDDIPAYENEDVEDRLSTNDPSDINTTDVERELNTAKGKTGKGDAAVKSEFTIKGIGYVKYDIVYNVGEKKWKLQLNEGDATAYGGYTKPLAKADLLKKIPEKVRDNIDLSKIESAITLNLIVGADMNWKQSKCDSRVDNIIYVMKLSPKLYGGVEFIFKTDIGGDWLGAGLEAFGKITLNYYLNEYFDNDGEWKRKEDRRSQKYSIEGDLGFNWWATVVFIEYDGTIDLYDADFATYYREDKSHWVNQYLKFLWDAGKISEAKYDLMLNNYYSDRTLDTLWNDAAPSTLLASSIFAESMIAQDYKMDILLTVNDRILSNSSVAPQYDAEEEQIYFISANEEGTEQLGVMDIDSGDMTLVSPSPGWDSELEVAVGETRTAAAWNRTADTLLANELFMNTMEVMVAISDGTTQTIDQLTDNDTMDYRPVVDLNENQTAVLWRNFTEMNEDMTEYESRLLYKVHDGSQWSEERLAYDGAYGEVESYDIAMTKNGTACIAYVIAGQKDINYSIVDMKGEVLSCRRLSNDSLAESDIKVTNVVDVRGAENFLLGYLQKEATDDAETTLNLGMIDSYGNFVEEFQHRVEAFDGDRFEFTENTDVFEDMYVLWDGYENEFVEEDGEMKFHVNHVSKGVRLIQREDGISSSYPMIIEKAESGTYFVDSCPVSHGDEIESLYLIGYSNEDGMQYQIQNKEKLFENDLAIIDVVFNADEIYQEAELPVEVFIENKGYQPIQSIIIQLGDQSFDKTLEIPLYPGEIGNYVIRYDVDSEINDIECAVTADFGRSLKADTESIQLQKYEIVFDKINLLVDDNRQRSYLYKLDSLSQKKLTAGEQIVKLGVYTGSEELSDPLIEFVIDRQEDLNRIMDGSYTDTFTLSEQAMSKILGSDGEIPAQGVVLNATVSIQDRQNDIPDYKVMDREKITIKSPIVYHDNEIFGFDTAIQYGDSEHTIQVLAHNYSMLAADGLELLIHLLDVEGNELEVIRLSDHYMGGMVIPGESQKIYSFTTTVEAKEVFVEYSDVPIEIGDLSIIDATSGSVEIVTEPTTVFAVDDEYMTDEDVTLSVLESGILSNDIGAVEVIVLDEPVNGSLELNGDGSFSYNPDENWYGTDSFTYQASYDILSDTAVVTIIVDPVNDAPIGVDDSFNTSRNESLNIPISALLMNDMDVDGDDLTVIIMSDVSNGVLQVNEDSTLEYIPSTDFIGEDKFTYIANDGIEDSNSTEVTIAVLNKSVELINVITESGNDEIEIGSSVQMIAEVKPDTAEVKTVIWSIENGTGSATIDANGLLTGVSQGEVVAIATAMDGSKIQGSIVLLIVSSEVLVSEILVEGQNGETTVGKEEMLQMFTTILPEDATDTTVTWNVSNGTDGGEASISENGELMGIEFGTVTVTATANDGSRVVGSCVITIE